MKTEEIRKLVHDNLNFLSSLSIPEYTLYQKWKEINSLSLNINDKQRIWELKRSLWIPDSPDDYNKIEPSLVLADSVIHHHTWYLLRVFTSTLKWTPNPGRLFRFFVMDKKTKNYIGVLSLSSDFLCIGGRDNVIGWNDIHKIECNRINNTLNCSSIVPIQPLGYNYTGGKLIALLAGSRPVQEVFEDRYSEKLVGITTTSLYGTGCQYDRLIHWKKCKASHGTVNIDIDNDIYEIAKQWLIKNFGKESLYEDKSHPKYKTTARICRELKIKLPFNNAPRGVYWNKLYIKTNEFLRCETDNPGEPLYDNSVNSLFSHWKEKYASKRINKLVNDGRYNNHILFYDDLIGMSWEDCKEKYINDVGR